MKSQLALLAAFFLISCKTTGRQPPQTSEVQGVDVIPGTTGADNRSASFRLSWPCSGNKRPNPNKDSEGKPVSGITQEEYCEWYFVPGTEVRTEKLEPLRCIFTNSFDASRSYFIPARNPKVSRYWDSLDLREVVYKGKKIGAVAGEKEDYDRYMSRISDQERKRWDTQFNTYRALVRLVEDCSPKGVRCEQINCVADRASDPLVCSAVQTVVNENQCQIGLTDFTSLPVGERRAQVTADPEFLETRRRHAKRDLMQEIIFKLEWHLQETGIIPRDQRLPSGFWRGMKTELVKLGVMLETEKLPFLKYETIQDEYEAKTPWRMPSNINEINAIQKLLASVKEIAFKEWNKILDDEKARNYQRLIGDTAYKLQLEIKPGVQEFCSYRIEKKLKDLDPNAEADHTLVDCTVPEGVAGTDLEEIRFCDELAQHIFVSARVDVNNCQKSLCNLLGCQDPDRPGTTVSRSSESRRVDLIEGASRATDTGLGGRSGRL